MTRSVMQHGTVPTWDLTDRLVKARKHAGLKQRDLAEAAGISVRSVANYELGHTRPRRPELLAWSMVCGVSLDWLEHGTGTAEGPRPDGPDGGSAECAIRDSNPEPAGSVPHARIYEFGGNEVHDPHAQRRLAAVASLTRVDAGQQWADYELADVA